MSHSRSPLQRYVRISIATGLIAGCSNSNEVAPGADAGAVMQMMDASPAMMDAQAPARSDAGDGGLYACNPLSDDPEPLTLGHVTAVGKASDGTLYVISGRTSDSTPDLAFISSSAGLQRQHVIGTGVSGSDAGQDFTVSLDEPTPTRLVAQRRAGAITGMAVAYDNDKTPYAALPASALQLTVVSASVLDGLPLIDLATQRDIRILANGTDGSQLLVTYPQDGGTDDDYRVYYGFGNALQQRVVTRVQVTLSSSYDLIFDTQSGPVHVTVPSQLPSLTPGAQLASASGVVALTLVSTNALPSNDTFSCFD